MTPRPTRCTRSLRGLGLAALALLWATAATAADLTGPGRAIDGETLEIGATTVRLHGIDAPEPGQPCARGGRPYDCAQEAGWALAERIGRHWLRCRERWQDQAGRIVATCTLGDGIDVGAHMVREGWALARRDEAEEYAALEDAARAARRGLWSGSFDPPSLWRQKSGQD